MKTVLLTIKPCWLNLIRTGKKTFEIRKTAPKVNEPFKVLCCESGSGGKITCEFVCDSVTKFYLTDKNVKHLCEKACISKKELYEYAIGTRNLYAWNVSNMINYLAPFKIEEGLDYYSVKGYRVRHISEVGLKRAPQSWQYVEDKP